MIIKENFEAAQKTYLFLPKNVWTEFSRSDTDALLEKLFESEEELKQNTTSQNCNYYIDHAQVVSKILIEKLNMPVLGNHVLQHCVVIGRTCIKIIFEKI